jgi:uncharacterized membrane protein (UPF0127 family)
MKKTIIILAALLLVAAVAWIMTRNRNPKHVPPPSAGVERDAPGAASGTPVFRKDGELKFVDSKTYGEIVRIDVEVADDENERMQGLMYRESLPEFAGMLFLMGVEEPQSFWMKNTKVPLDIIYVNSDNVIVTICRNTRPYSLDQVLSEKPALYVVEVNAGFAAKHGIKTGDKIIF